MTDNYINNINARKEKDDLKQEVMFGQGFGLALILLVGFHFYKSSPISLYLYFHDAKYIFFNKSSFTILVGIVIFILGLFYPYILHYPLKIVKSIVNKIFNFIFSFILAIIYFILIIPVSLLIKKKWKKDYNFSYWQNTYNNIHNSSFKDKKVEFINLNENKRKSKYKVIKQIVNYFYSNKQYILIPVLLIMLFLGLLFFFITSSVITPMIYTIF